MLRGARTSPYWERDALTDEETMRDVAKMLVPHE